MRTDRPDDEPPALRLSGAVAIAADHALGDHLALLDLLRPPTALVIEVTSGQHLDEAT
ncbi:MAG: hypothetical protein ACT4P1_08515 [Sporichthyaceae bacterium]